MRRLLRLARRHHIRGPLDDFYQTTLTMGQWRQWLPEPHARTASDDDKVLLGGCYALTTAEGRTLIAHIDAAAESNGHAENGGSATATACIAAVKDVMTRYHQHLG